MTKEKATQMPLGGGHSRALQPAGKHWRPGARTGRLASLSMRCARVGVVRIFLCILLLCVATAVVAASRIDLVPDDAPPAMVLATTMSPPLSEPDQTGMLDQVISEAFRRIGVTVSFRQLPSERALVMADNGQVDGDANRISGLQADYPNLLQVPEPNMTYAFTAFALRPDVEVHGWSDLKKYTVGYIIGWKFYDEHVFAASTVKVATPENLFTLLRAGRVDVALYYRLGGLYYGRKLGLINLRVLEPPLATRTMYIYLNNRHANLVPRLTEMLRGMKRDGSYQRIVAPFQGG